MRGGRRLPRRLRRRACRRSAQPRCRRQGVVALASDEAVSPQHPWAARLNSRIWILAHVSAGSLAAGAEERRRSKGAERSETPCA
eukprot:9570302-Alexandrium_andersonii.AAC.1